MPGQVPGSLESGLQRLLAGWNSAVCGLDDGSFARNDVPRFGCLDGNNNNTDSSDDGDRFGHDHGHGHDHDDCSGWRREISSSSARRESGSSKYRSGGAARRRAGWLAAYHGWRERGGDRKIGSDETAEHRRRSLSGPFVYLFPNTTHPQRTPSPAAPHLHAKPPATADDDGENLRHSPQRRHLQCISSHLAIPSRTDLEAHLSCATLLRLVRALLALCSLSARPDSSPDSSHRSGPHPSPTEAPSQAH
ncbi:hypothetical protein DRE_06211 [Drechslerella stenobrocha 248]|uniref:Uncharacterized protein n=1 Tax=Drechslerella stenobrocha 248 TaxID=1043628 RepID=W7HY69_9PEZI|nr:hypothetical protein DRE_06211 [Drechslerella stenobrocha 248]